MYGIEYVVLAAGESRRMGFDKAVTPLEGRSPLARILNVLAKRNVTIVVPQKHVAVATDIAPDATIVVNDEQQRGMVHSLRLALCAIDSRSPFGVLLGDMPSMTGVTIDRTENLLRSGVDVAYPADANGTPGHPVVFSAQARFVIETLPEGDAIRHARDHSSLRRASWLCNDRSAFRDLDVPEEWAAFSDA
jgi:molybdenum cofactor cytidylyltransferase